MSALDYLNTFTNFEMHLNKVDASNFSLERMTALLKALGDPQKDLKIIHVAGTKGKGSTCAFLSYILATAGYKVGLYTSPHIHQVNERIRILDKKILDSDDDLAGQISNAELDEIVEWMRPHTEAIRNKQGLTYFEVLTAAALVYFHRRKMDWVILETGLGGRLDATNAAHSLIAVITPISLDHTHILGKTVEAIAVEKAAIIKSFEQRVVVAPQDPKAMEVILKRCQEFNLPVVVADPNQCELSEINLEGEHQKINAACAVYVATLLHNWGHKISLSDIQQGLRQTRWPGRFEIISRNPTVILDCAHNQASALALAQTITNQYPQSKVTAILGFSSDKDVKAIIDALKSVVHHFIFTQAQHSRAYAFDSSLLKQWMTDQSWEIVNDAADAIERAKQKIQNSDIIIVAGSIFLVAEVRKLLLNLE